MAAILFSLWVAVNIYSDWDWEQLFYRPRWGGFTSYTVTLFRSQCTIWWDRGFLKGDWSVDIYSGYVLKNVWMPFGLLCRKQFNVWWAFIFVFNGKDIVLISECLTLVSSTFLNVRSFCSAVYAVVYHLLISGSSTLQFLLIGTIDCCRYFVYRIYL